MAHGRASRGNDTLNRLDELPEKQLSTVVQMSRSESERSHLLFKSGTVRYALQLVYTVRACMAG